jgi:hypothetical protein
MKKALNEQRRPLLQHLPGDYILKIKTDQLEDSWWHKDGIVGVETLGRLAEGRWGKQNIIWGIVGRERMIFMNCNHSKM